MIGRQEPWVAGSKEPGVVVRQEPLVVGRQVPGVLCRQEPGVVGKKGTRGSRQTGNICSSVRRDNVA